MKTNFNDAIAKLRIARDVAADELCNDNVPPVQAVTFELYKMLAVLLASCQAASGTKSFRDKTALILLQEETNQMELTKEFQEAAELAKGDIVNGNFLKRYREAKVLLADILED